MQHLKELEYKVNLNGGKQNKLIKSLILAA